MQRLTTMIRLTLATLMMLGMFAFAGSSALADDEGTPVAEETEAPVSVLPETGTNGPDSTSGDALLIASAVIACSLLAGAAVVRRVRMN